MTFQAADLRPLLTRAATLRAHLPGQGTTIYRAAHLSETGGTFTLERAGEVGVLSLYRECSPQTEALLVEACAQALGCAALYLKRRPSEARHLANVQREWLSPAEPAWGDPRPEVVVHENGVPFLVRPGSDLSTGLFSDMRPARAWLRQNAGESVLNTFAYTCGFGVVATLGGAAVKNLDASRKVLGWGRENYALSGLEASQQDFIFGDVFGWLERFARRSETFERVILDPPSFARVKRGTWRAERDYAELARLAACVVAPGGLLLAATNHAGISPVVFGRMVSRGIEAAGRRGRTVTVLGAGEDYPQATHLKVQVKQLK